MLTKIKILIIASIIGLLALSIVQAYLIQNTYQLKKNAFIKEAKKEVSKIDDFSPPLDAINDRWQESFLKIVADYKIKRIEKNTVLSRLKESTDSLSKRFTKIYAREINKKKNPFTIKIQKQVKTIIILDSIKNDTIFFSNASTPKIHLLGDIFDDKESHKINNSIWETEYIFSIGKDNHTAMLSYNLYFETEDIININSWKKIIFNQMKGLLILSFLIFAFVIALFYYSIKNLITQKKIADIKTDFVNNITHELKTPLATLSLATKILQTDTIKDQPTIIQQTLTTIDRQNKRLQKLIDQVLNNSLGYNEIKLSKENVIANEYLSVVLDDFLLSVGDKNVILTKTLSPSNKEIVIDKFYFTTALLNILENAVKYNEGSIEIRCTTAIKDCFIITISDNGMGISEKNLKLIFEKFFRVNNNEIHNVKGLGLGLYYTYQIIKAHNGKIEVKSSVGNGATFIITIPLI